MIERRVSIALWLMLLLMVAGCQSPETETDDLVSAETLQLGETVYATHCASCHGAELEGQPDWRSANEDGTWKAPPHDETGHTWHHPDAYLLDRIRNGTGGLDAQMQALSNMPAYADLLNDAEIDAVLAYIKSAWPADIQASQAAMNE